MLIDKETAYKELKQKEEMYGLSFTAEAFGKAARIVDQMYGADAAKIAKLCNEIEDLITESFAQCHINCKEYKEICKRTEEIRKELTVNDT